MDKAVKIAAIVRVVFGSIIMRALIVFSILWCAIASIIIIKRLDTLTLSKQHIEERKEKTNEEISKSDVIKFILNK